MTKARVSALLLIALLAPILTVAAGVIANRNLRSSNERSLVRNEPAKTSFPHARQAAPGPRMASFHGPGWPCDDRGMTPRLPQDSSRVHDGYLPASSSHRSAATQGQERS